MQSLASSLSLLICVCFPAVSSAQSLTLGQEPAARDQAEQISEYVREVFQDRDGNFWFGTNGDGVCRYDGKSLTYLSVEEGFGGRAVRGILQDSDGVMWFATNGGVSRYEAGIFTNYTEANGLSNNNVWSIMLDSAGTIWVGTHGGVCRFDGKSFVPFPLPRVEVENPKSRFSPKVVFGMFEDQAGNLWFGTDGEGVHMYDGKSFTSYTQKDGLAGNMVRCIQGDRHGRIWIGTNGDGVSCYDGTTFRNFTKKDGLNNDRIYEILEDRAGNMWFSTLGAGACRYDGKTFTAFREDYSLMINDYPARGHVQEFFEDRDGILWIGCSGGLFRFDGKTFINVTKNGPWPAPNTTDVQEPDDSAAPTPERLRFKHGVRSILEDSKGNFWFGTWQEGVARFDGEKLTYFTVEDGLDSNQVRNVFEDRNGTIWFETGDAICSYDGKKITIHTDRDYNSKDDWNLGDGDLWFKEDDGRVKNVLEGQPGVYRYDGETLTYLAFPLPEVRDSAGGYGVTGMARGKSGKLWIGTYQAVIGYDGESFTIIDHESLGVEERGRLGIRCVLEDSKGNLWIGSNGLGVFLHDGETNINFTEEHGLGKRDAGDESASLHQVFSIGEDRAGDIWFGTLGYGAWRYDGESLRNFTEEDGLTSKGIMVIYTDRRGDLWLGGNGVFKFNGESFDRIH